MRIRGIWLFVLFAFGGLAKDLAFDRVIIQQIEDGPPIEGGYEFLPGETAWLSFRVTGFEAKDKDKDEEIRTVSLKYTITVDDPAGVPAVPPFSGAYTSDIRSEDKDWVPRVRREILLPDHAIRGKYKISLWLKDEVSGAEARRDITLDVRNRDVASSEELVARNFGFYKGENDRRAMTEPAFTAGEPVLVRFDVTGYVLGPKNAIFVEYGLKVTGPDEKVVIDQPTAAAEQSSSFYPRRWLPVAFRLDLPPNPSKGEYVLTVELRDKTAGKNLELKRNFTVN